MGHGIFTSSMSRLDQTGPPSSPAWYLLYSGDHVVLSQDEVYGGIFEKSLEWVLLPVK